MIIPRKDISAADVAQHYDKLDYFYRGVWGEHLHHGLWDSADDHSSSYAATVRLLERVVAPLDLQSSSLVADIGCGYGTSARHVAERWHCRVLACTVSPVQAAMARSQAPHTGSVEIEECDWARNTLADESLDAAYAIESLAHMQDKQEFFHQLARSLKPGARASLACWTHAPDLSLPETLLIRAVCEEGRIPGMGTRDEYAFMAERAGFKVIRRSDLSRKVARTWWLIARRVLAGLSTDMRYWQMLGRRAFRGPTYALTIPRLLLAYHTGALRYYHLLLSKAPGGAPAGAQDQ